MSYSLWFVELVEISMTPRNPELLKMNQGRIYIVCREILLLTFQNLKYVLFNKRVPWVLEVRLISSSKSRLWNQYLPKNMKWASWIFNSIEGILPTHPPTIRKVKPAFRFPPLHQSTGFIERQSFSGVPLIYCGVLRYHDKLDLASVQNRMCTRRT